MYTHIHYLITVEFAYISNAKITLHLNNSLGR